MTVKELIKYLERYPKDAKVVEYTHGDPILYVLLDKDTEKVQLVY